MTYICSHQLRREAEPLMRPVSMVIFQHKCRKAEDAIALLETGDGGADFMDKAREGH